jgi:phosphoglycolate phosphatase
MIELVCLDMAGTTVRDDGAVLAAFESALVEIGLPVGTDRHRRAREYALATMGQTKIDVFRTITEQDEHRAQAANGALEKAYEEGLASNGAQPIGGAVEAIDELRATGVKVVLTTGFSVTTRDALLASLGWQNLVDLVLSPADAGRGRPYPDMILTAVIRLGVEDVRGVAAAGDTSSDLLAATRAGASMVVGVLTGAHGEREFARAPHTHILPSVAELPALVAAANTTT